MQTAPSPGQRAARRPRRPANQGSATAQTTPAAPEREPQRRRTDIQGLRALAVLLVVAFHAGLPFPGGFTGVDVFFVISGCVITAMLLGELEQTGRIDLWRFYGRRIRRLLPALALMLSAVALVGVLASPIAAQAAGAKTGMWASVFLANADLYRVPVGYFDVGSTVNPLLHTWTLAVEEQFYVLFPAILLISFLFYRGRRGAIVVVGLVSAASFGLAVGFLSGWHVPGINAPGQFAFYSSLTRAWEFGAGALIALAIGLRTQMPKLVAHATAVLGLAAVLAGALLIHEVDGFPGLVTLVPVGGTAALLIAGAATQGGIARLLSTRPAVWIGDLSYSWYLWHWPFIVFAVAMWPATPGVAAAAGAASLLPAWLSFKYVENPIRFGSRFRGRAILALAAICISVPIVASVGLLAAESRLARTNAVQMWQQGQVLHEDKLRGCDSEVPLGMKGPDCTWRVPNARGTVVLIGDSQAGQFTEPFVQAANRAGYDAVVATLRSCPVADLRMRSDWLFTPPSACAAFIEGSMRALKAMRPSLVVMASRADEYIENTPVAFLDEDRSWTTRPADKAAIYQRGLKRVLASLTAARVPALVVHPVPKLRAAPDECSVLRVLTYTCSGSVSRESADAQRHLAIDAERAALRDSGSRAIAFDRDLCSADTCRATERRTYIYRNVDHLSVEGALTLTPRFYDEIVAHARTS